MKSEDYKKYILDRSYKHSLNTINLIDSLNNRDFSVQILSKQLLRSATSVGANIMEAQAASTPKDFTSFLNYALKSANESIFWIKLLHDSGKAKNTNNLLQETTELAKILGSSLRSLRNRKE